MAGRRGITVVALAAAVMLLAPSGWAWAHPGKSHGHAKVHHSHVHKSAHARGHHHGSQDDTVNQPTVFSPTNAQSSGKPGKASTRHHTDHGNGRSSHTDLASHPGEAKGLVKHADRVSRRVNQPQPGFTPPPPTPPTTPTTTPPNDYVAGPGGTSYLPTRHQPVGHRSGSPSRPQTGNSGQHVAVPPPVTGPQTSPKTPKTLAQVLLRSNTMQFSALPLLIISVLALCVAGLVKLARLRA